jgi:hypothetical protein
MKLSTLICLLCVYLSAALVRHEHSSGDIFTKSSFASTNASADGSGAKPVQLLTDGDEERHGKTASEKLDSFDQGHCKWMVIAYLAACCCSVPLVACVGEKSAALCQFLIIFFIVFYVIDSGLLSSWWSGKNVYISCQLLCFLVAIQIASFLCVCCLCLCVPTLYMSAFFVIKNETIKKMHADFEEKKKSLSGPRRAYYDSELFKNKCDRLFQEADTDGNGVLSFEELKPVIMRELDMPKISGSGDDAKMAEFVGQLEADCVAQAFDRDRNSTLEQAEFVYMMQFLSLKKFEEGKFSESTAWEVLQLDPAMATHADVKRQYRKMSLQYHPDKNPLKSDEENKRDMAEINDAKKILDTKFENRGTPGGPGQP